MPRLSPVSPASVKSASPEPLLPCEDLFPSVPAVPKATLRQATTSRSRTSIEKLRLRRRSFLGTLQPLLDRPECRGVRSCPLNTPSKTLKANSALGTPRDDDSHLEEAAKEVHHTEHGAARTLRPPAAPDHTAEPSSGRHPAPRPMVCPGPPRSPASATRPRRARASPQGLVQTPVPPAH